MPAARRYWIADAHADSLMWNRDLTQASTKGHVDFPRLQEAGVGLQCFTIVTRGFPFVGGFPVFAAAHGWPWSAVTSPWAAAVRQVEQLHAAAEKSAGAVRIVGSAQALKAQVASGGVSAVLGIEGAHALEGKVERVAELHRRGVRFMSLTHLSNNDLGGSGMIGMGDRPLTALGHAVLEEMGRVGMTVDVAHASPRTLADVLATRAVRPFCSHTGVAAIASPWRNLDDVALKAIADRGGVVGVIFAKIYLGGKSIAQLVKHIQHAVNVMGVDGVGLGSDFDGMVALPEGMKDVRDVSKVLDALVAAGFAEGDVEKIAGLNLRRYFEETLGDGKSSGGR